MDIIVSNLNKKHRIDKIFVKKIAANILKILKKSSNTKLEIVFLDNRAIRPINKRYKGADRATDVLSFDLGQCGQVLISSEMALKNSRAFKMPLEKELILYVIHGILHLFGYDDEKPKTRSRMVRKQNYIMEMICANINLSKVLTRR